MKWNNYTAGNNLSTFTAIFPSNWRLKSGCWRCSLPSRFTVALNSTPVGELKLNSFDSSPLDIESLKAALVFWLSFRPSTLLTEIRSYLVKWYVDNIFNGSAYNIESHMSLIVSRHVKGMKHNQKVEIAMYQIFGGGGVGGGKERKGGKEWMHNHHNAKLT